MRIFDRLVANVHDGDKVAYAGIGTRRGSSMINKQECENVLNKFKEYRYTSQQTYESISREMNVSYATVVRWLNSTKAIRISPVYLDTIINFLKTKGVNLALAIVVSWQLNFKSQGPWVTYNMSRELETYEEVANFIIRAPKEGKLFDCEHWGEHGYCSVQNFDIDSNVEEEHTEKREEIQNEN